MERRAIGSSASRRGPLLDSSRNSIRWARSALRQMRLQRLACTHDVLINELGRAFRVALPAQIENLPMFG